MNLGSPWYLKVQGSVSLFECVRHDCSDSLELQTPDAGMHVVAWLKNGLGDHAAHHALLEAGIESLPLSVYYIRPLKRQGIVLGFSCAPETRIPVLVKRMSDALRRVPS